MSDNKPVYTDSSFTEHLKRREEDDYQPLGVKVEGQPVEKSEDGYVGVSPEYRNYANDTEKPGVAEEGPEAEIEKRYLAEDFDVDKGAAPQGVDEAQEQVEEDEEDDADKKGPTTSPTPPTPPKS